MNALPRIHGRAPTLCCCDKATAARSSTRCVLHVRPFAAALPHASSSPADRCQRPLSKVEKNDMRAASQRLGRQLVTVQIGRQGITRNLIVALGDALARNELVKVKIGGGSDLDTEQVYDILTSATDSVCVHTVGFTLTLYRDKSLPRPLSSMLAAQSDVSSSQHHDVDYDEVIASRSMAPAIHQRADAKPAMARSNPPAMQVLTVATRQPIRGDSRAQSSGSNGGSGSSSSSGSRQQNDPAGLNSLLLRVIAVGLVVQIGRAAVTEAAEWRQSAGIGAIQNRCVVLAANPAILQGLQRRQTAQRSGEAYTTSGERRVQQLQKVQAQLGRIKLLADLNEYDSARLELREGAALGLRRDLRGAEEDYIAIKGKMVKDAVNSIETLDVALKTREPAGAVKTLAQDAADKIAVVIGGLQASDAADSTASPSPSD